MVRAAVDAPHNRCCLFFETGILLIALVFQYRAESADFLRIFVSMTFLLVHVQDLLASVGQHETHHELEGTSRATALPFLLGCWSASASPDGTVQLLYSSDSCALH